MTELVQQTRLLLIQSTSCCRQRMQRLFAASQTASQTAATMLAQSGGTLQVGRAGSCCYFADTASAVSLFTSCMNSSSSRQMLNAQLATA